MQTERAMQYMNFQGPSFILEVPVDWVVSSSPQFQAIFLGPADQPVRPNVLISIRPLEENVTVAQVAEQTRLNQERDYPQYEIIAEIDFTEQGGVGFLRRYRWLNTEGNTPIVQTQAFFVYNNLLYSITATRAESIPENVANLLDDIFDHMIESFRLSA